MFAPKNLGPTITVTAFTLTAISTVVVGIRFCCRLWVVGKLKLYDYLIGVAILLTWVNCVANYYQVETGTGTHLDPDWNPLSEVTGEPLRAYNALLRKAAIAWFTYRVTYVFALGFIKLSILVFYLSFATSRTFKNLAIISLVVVALFTAITGFLNGFECPKDPSLTLSAEIFDQDATSQCVNRAILYYCQASFHIFSDLFILILPMPSLLQLRMPNFKRMSLIAVFSIGSIVPIASACRIWGLWIWSDGGGDGRYNGGYMLFWSQVEINVAIVCASAPSFQPLFKFLLHHILNYRTNSAYYTYGSHSQAVAANRFGERRVRNTEESSVLPPPTSFQPNKYNMSGTDNELVVIREMDEDIGGRIRQDAAGRIRLYKSSHSLADSENGTGSQKPEKPKEMLPYG